jgi:ATP-dependent helicase/nuclease subunit A
VPPDDWTEIISRITPPREISAELATEAVQEACRLLLDEKIKWIFAQDGLSEVPLTAELSGNILMGVIDRLLVAPDHVIAVDFKTNMAVPAGPELCPEGLLRQMGAYAEALKQIYPDRRIDTGILWTATGQYMGLPNKLVSEALMRSPHLDAAGSGS